MLRAFLPVLLLPLLAVGCGGDGDGGSDQPRPVTIVLDFTPNAAHAGIYAAVARHRDRDHGVRLTVRQPTASSDSLKLLAVGRADLAVADIHDLGLARERGEDLVGVGALVQRPLASVIAGPEVTRPRQLEGKRVGVTGVPSDEAVLRAVVGGDGGHPERVRTITIGFTAVPSLIEGKVDAATAFWSVEGVVLKRRGVKTHEFRVDSFGAPRYPELVLVARRDTVEQDPGLLKDTLATLADGTRDALADRPAAVTRVASAAQARPELIAAELDAIAPALSPPIRLNPSALAGWAAFDLRLAILKRRPIVSEAFALDLAPDVATMAATAAARRPRVKLAIAVHDGRGHTRRATLSCRSRAHATGFLRHAPRRHCRTARELRYFLASKPDPRRPCAEIYGGPQTARVQGQIGGRTIDRRFHRKDGCGIDDWENVKDLLGGVPRS